jgi:hypothetical protein
MIQLYVQARSLVGRVDPAIFFGASKEDARKGATGISAFVPCVAPAANQFHLAGFEAEIGGEGDEAIGRDLQKLDKATFPDCQASISIQEVEISHGHVNEIDGIPCEKNTKNTHCEE